MAGFAALVQPGSTAGEREEAFQGLLKDTARFRELDAPVFVVEGKSCTAAKLDAPISIHRGAASDERTGSWLIAAGTVAALEGDNDPQVVLSRLLADYLARGPVAMARYDGHFALAIYDGREDSFSLLSDGMGLFSLYYARRGRQTFVSTSGLALAHYLSAKADELVLECFLRAGRTHGEKTLWEGVKRVRPATVIKITAERFEEREYWAFEPDRAITRLPMREALEAADAKIRGVYSRFLARESSVWADLTGGFDTRLTAVYLDKMGIPFTAYCAGPEGHPDVEISRQVAQVMGWPYRHVPPPEGWEQERVNWLERAAQRADGQLNVVQLAGVLRGVQERIPFRNVHVVGNGADEWREHSFGQTFGNFLGQSKQLDYHAILDRHILSTVPRAVMRANRDAETRQELRALVDGINAKVTAYDAWMRASIVYIRYRHPIHAGAYLSAEAGLGRALIPFCFKELETFGISVRPSWRVYYQYHFIRCLLEYNSPRLAGIMTDRGGPASPIRLSNAHRFMPLYVEMVNKVSRKVTSGLLGRPVAILPSPKSAQPKPAAPQKYWLDWALANQLLDPAHMCTGALYNADALAELIAQERAGASHTGEFLEWVLTLEMAMRASGASLG